MLQQNWKVVSVLGTALITLFFYYFQFPHGESGSWLLIYFIATFFFYLCYKAYYILLEYDTIEFGLGKILSFFLSHFFFLCVFLFLSSGSSALMGMIFFSKILFFLILIVLIYILVYLVWRSILGYILKAYDSTSLSQKSWFFLLNTLSWNQLLHKKEETLLSFALGIISFFFCISLLAFFWYYSKTSVLLLFFFFFLFSLREILPTLNDLKSLSWSFENHQLDANDPQKFYRPYLLSTEFLFIVVTGLISVNFISVFRPFPIGWDDLGVYMNYPKLLAEVGGNMPLWSMYPWQLFTGIWYLFHSQTFAFLLNSFSSVIAFFVIFLWFSSLLPKDSKTFFNIPLLSWTIFLGLPMVVFQTAKDMKLDIGLFSVSFLAVMLLYILYSHISRLDRKHILLLLISIGALAWLAFTIKVTSLLLISSIIGVIFYFFLWYFWFLSYIFLYISIFTFWNLWGVMNVTFPSDNSLMVFWVSLLSLLLSIIFFYFSIRWEISRIRTLWIHLSLFLLGVIFSFLPWGIKNISELSNMSEFTIYRLIWGKIEYFEPDYLSIYNAKEYAEKTKLLTYQSLDENGNTKNEDLGRYFGYEEGINNYLKLPWNLTMQVNQKGEFTDIGFLFLAFIPSLFLFLPSRNKYFYSWILGLLFLGLIYFIPGPLSYFISSIFDIFKLPFGYLIILAIYLGCSSFLFFSLEKKDKLIEIFVYNLIFSTFFVFLWAISAFWVVWYGISMYGAFLFMIATGYFYLSEYQDHESEEIKDKKLSQSFLIFGIFLIYIFMSIIPRYVSNLQSSSFIDYKMGEYSENRAVFTSHPEYLDTLFALNIDDTKKDEFIRQYKNIFLQILTKYQMNEEVFTYLDSIQDIKSLESFALQVTSLSYDGSDIKILSLQKEMEGALEELYNNLIYPRKEFLSQQKIYKIGTFMRYFISDNTTRILEDSLVVNFDTYMFDTDSNLTAERIKKLWIGYLLVDLNAATIDNDPRKDLTRRYENLLSSFVWEKFQLVDTDSICLKVALEDYQSEKSMPSYILRAGINYDSYLNDNTLIERGKKLQDCHTRIIEILRDPSIDKTQKYTYLWQIMNYLAQNGKNLDDEWVLRDILMKFWVWYKALFKIQ